MEAVIVRNTLAEETTWVTRVIPQRPISPILNGLHISAGADGDLRFAATDNSAASSTVVEGEVLEAGDVVVPGKLLASIAGLLPQKQVTLKTKGSKLTVTCDRSDFSLPTFSVEDYPKPPAQYPDSAGTIIGSVFSDAVAQVTFAAAKDETLPVLTGVKIKCSDEYLTLVATDRLRLAVKKIAWDGAAREPILTRARLLADFAKPASSHPVEMSIDNVASLFGLVTGPHRSTMPLMDSSTYPDVERLVPIDAGTTVVEADIAELADAVKRVSLVTDDRSHQPIRLTFGNEEIHLVAGGGADADASEAVQGIMTGERVETAFNPNFLLDALLALSGDTVRIQLAGPSRAVLLTAPDDDTYQHVLMPVKVAQR